MGDCGVLGLSEVLWEVGMAKLVLLICLFGTFWFEYSDFIKLPYSLRA